MDRGVRRENARVDGRVVTDVGGDAVGGERLERVARWKTGAGLLLGRPSVGDLDPVANRQAEVASRLRDRRPGDKGNDERGGSVAPTGLQGVKTGTQRDEEGQQSEVAGVSNQAGNVLLGELVVQREAGEQKQAAASAQCQDEPIASREQDGGSDHDEGPETQQADPTGSQVERDKRPLAARVVDPAERQSRFAAARQDAREHAATYGEQQGSKRRSRGGAHRCPTIVGVRMPRGPECCGLKGDPEREHNRSDRG